MEKISIKLSRVLIMGAGVGGLTLAQGLKRAKIPFTIFERDASRDFRPQGYRLRINAAGADALKCTIDHEHWDLFERTCAETKPGGTSVNPLDGGLIMRNPTFGPPQDVGKSYTADRTTLRGMLLLGLEDHMSFGKEFQKYTITPNGVTAHFSDGSVEEGALLVGADGMRSRVRRQYLPDHVPVDTEGRCVYGKTLITDELKDRFTADAMEHMTIITDKTREKPLTLFIEPVRFSKDVGSESKGKLPSVKDYIYWVLLSRQSTFGLADKDLLSMSSNESADFSLKLTQNWALSVRALLELQDRNQSSSLRISSALPNIPVWNPSANVTLLGDAIHVMSPTGGVGANTALRDAANLCQALVEKGISAETIGKYEEQMRDYAGKAIESSYSGGKKMYDQPPFEECKPVQF